MIDKSLARMIDESLRKLAKIDGFCRRKMLEIRVNQAHLTNLPLCRHAPSKAGNFIRDPFTIQCFAAFDRS